MNPLNSIFPAESHLVALFTRPKPSESSSSDTAPPISPEDVSQTIHDHHLPDQPPILIAQGSPRVLFECEICGSKLTTRANLNRHKQRHGEMKHQCVVCNKRFFRTDQLAEHSVKHMKNTNTILECPIEYCHDIFQDKKTLKKHVDDVHKLAWGNMGKCKRCFRTFAKTDRLMVHYRSKHGDELLVPPSFQPEANQNDEIIQAILQGQLAYQTPTDNVIGTDTDMASLEVEVDTSSEAMNSNQSSPNEVDISPEVLQMFLSNLLNPVAPMNPGVPVDFMAQWLSDPKLSVTPPVVPMNLNLEQLGSEEQTSSSVSVKSMSPGELAQKSGIVGTCTHCKMDFKDETLYLIHQNLHSDLAPFNCALCGHACENKQDFMIHMIMQQHDNGN